MFNMFAAGWCGALALVLILQGEPLCAVVNGVLAGVNGAIAMVGGN
jgi:hypothetical protein